MGLDELRNWLSGTTASHWTFSSCLYYGSEELESWATVNPDLIRNNIYTPSSPTGRMTSYRLLSGTERVVYSHRREGLGTLSVFTEVYTGLQGTPVLMKVNSWRYTMFRGRLIYLKTDVQIDGGEG